MEKREKRKLQKRAERARAKERKAQELLNEGFNPLPPLAAASSFSNPSYQDHHYSQGLNPSPPLAAASSSFSSLNPSPPLAAASSSFSRGAEHYPSNQDTQYHHSSQVEGRVPGHAVEDAAERAKMEKREKRKLQKRAERARAKERKAQELLNEDPSYQDHHYSQGGAEHYPSNQDTQYHHSSQGFNFSPVPAASSSFSGNSNPSPLAAASSSGFNFPSVPAASSSFSGNFSPSPLAAASSSGHLGSNSPIRPHHQDPSAEPMDSEEAEALARANAETQRMLLEIKQEHDPWGSEPMIYAPDPFVEEGNGRFTQAIDFSSGANNDDDPYVLPMDYTTTNSNNPHQNYYGSDNYHHY